MKKKITHYFNKKKVILFSFILAGSNLLAQTVTIPIATEDNMLLLQTDNTNRLRTVYFGKPLENQGAW